MALERPDDAQAKLAYKNAATRMIEIKERHAQHWEGDIVVASLPTREFVKRVAMIDGKDAGKVVLKYGHDYSGH